MLPHLLTRWNLNIPFLLLSFTVFRGVSCHQYGRPVPPHFINRRYSDAGYFLPEECYGSYPRKPHYCSTPEEQDKNVYYFIPEIVVPTSQTSYAYHVSRPPYKPRGPSRFPNFSQIKRRYHKLWLKVKPRFIYLKNKLAELPPPVKAIPILMTVARTAMMVKSQIDEVRKLQQELEESEEESMESTSPAPPPLDKISDAELEKQAKQDKIQLDTQIVGLVAESLNLASNKLSLINTLAKTAMTAGIGGRDDLGDALEESQLLDRITENDNSIIDELRKHHAPGTSKSKRNSTLSISYQ